MQGVPVEEVLLFEVRDGRCIGDLRNYIGELLRRKQLMSCVHTGGEDFWRGQNGNGARESRRREANNGRSAEEIRRTSEEEKTTLEIISIYL